MWIPKIISINKEGGEIRIGVQYTNRMSTVNQEYRLTSLDPKNWFEGQVREKIKQLDRIYDFTDTLILDSQIDTIEIVIPPTQTEIDQKTFLKDIFDIRQMEKAIHLECKTSLDHDYLALKNKIKTTYKPQYNQFL